MQAKPIWQSKTFWLNVVAGGLEIAQAVGDLKLVPPGTITVIAAIGNIILRRITSSPVTFAKPSEGQQ